jgi:hypothetical protein
MTTTRTPNVDLGKGPKGRRRLTALNQLALAGDHMFDNKPSYGRLICALADHTILVTVVETRPEIDPYHADTGQFCQTELHIHPAERRCGISQVYDQGATDAAVWHNRVLAYTLDFRPDQDAAESYLISPPAQALLARICDGHDVDWDGNNHKGTLNLDAHAAIDQLIDGLDNLPRNIWQLYPVADYLADAHIPRLTAASTDADLEQIAQALDDDAQETHHIIDGDILEYLTDQRTELRESEE